jgi:hypothetical protein
MSSPRTIFGSIKADLAPFLIGNAFLAFGVDFELDFDAVPAFDFTFFFVMLSS